MRAGAEGQLTSIWRIQSRDRTAVVTSPSRFRRLFLPIIITIHSTTTSHSIPTINSIHTTATTSTSNNIINNNNSSSSIIMTTHHTLASRLAYLSTAASTTRPHHRRQTPARTLAAQLSQLPRLPLSTIIQPTGYLLTSIKTEAVAITHRQHPRRLRRHHRQLP